MVEKGSGGGCENDIIDVQEQISRMCGGVEDEEGRIRAGGSKTEAVNVRSKALRPSSRRLFEAIKRAREETHVARVASINKAGRLLAVNTLCEMAVEERVRHIQLVDMPIARHGEL